ncbi:gastric triacylglycerol lipase-like [Hydractinia symbiolongicarpus]|uniref:gastric triacylglycerol lipase-like n=1 Tax=Hydractinia symbiolongicarpus TaxID=13093 RepID=UPI00254F47D1|nr:gastric triacylglycerol lipase-like [Hydractinia symbiolongicarpus]
MFLGFVACVFLLPFAWASPAVIHKYGTDSLRTHIKFTKKYLDNLPEEHMNVSQMIKYHGYPCENHDVVTEDGYILSLQRIPHGRKEVPPKHEVVFLQHGLIDSSATWVNNLPEQSLGFILADLGYDVWLGNSRGNTYSKRHVNLTTDDPKFWDFSFNEMAQFDLPASLNYALKISNTSQLYYTGHSQGTMIGFIQFGRQPELGKKVKTFFALAPVATVGYIKGALKIMSYFSPEIEFLIKILGIKDFFPNNWLMKLLADTICAAHFSEKYCADLIFLMTGFDTKNLNDTRIPIYVSHTPAGTSVKDILHFVQLIKSKKFQRYDYGEAENLVYYNQTTPPCYDVSLMETPVALFTATNDWLADPEDVKGLKPKLKNIVFSKNIEVWNHMDFVWGEDAHSVIYADIIKLLQA